ncbi:MAG TPA: hypothetical protein VK836_21270 [Streptosporangiaceae bacterium]|nr:hypothetical protein [Streptosporangiaceae bacterium]
MSSDDDPSRAKKARHALTAPPGSGQLPSRPGSGRLVAPPGIATAVIARRARLAASRRRPWWKWLLISLLLVFTITTTGLYAAGLIRDISVHHWGSALDESRDAVPAAVGWAALLLLFFPKQSPEAERLLSDDNHALSEKLRQAARDQASMDNAELKLQRLTARLARLTTAQQVAASAGRPASSEAAARTDAGVTYLDPGAAYLETDDAELRHEVAETTARLEQARQWLAGARDAVAISQRAVADAEERLMADFPDLARQPDRAARKPA